MKKSKRSYAFSAGCLSIVFVGIVLAACGDPYIHRTADLSNNVTTLTLDGSRRAIITKLVDEKGTDSQESQERVFVCAEPSPDAMGTLAAAFAAKGSYKTVSAEANATINTDVIKLFNRSQGIQALRDGMYRLCEARANSAINDETYAQQIRQLTATLNFVIPIEVCSTMATNSTEGASAFNTCVASAKEMGLSMHLSESLLKELLPIMTKLEKNEPLSQEQERTVNTLKKIFERN